ncbi:MAG: hypothetical protein S4CHLAM2_05060 [Chlamydiales bacterium]|nr:hypothetical protein [Chlamydiales bacterium]
MDFKWIAILLAVTTTGFGASFVIPRGDVETATQMLDGAEEIGLVEEGGAISVDGITGVEASAADTQMRNEGLIFTTGASAIGIAGTVGATNFQVTNTNQLTTTGATSSGIETLGAGTNILNIGLVTTRGDTSFGIYAQGDNSYVLNKGTVSTSGASSAALRNSGSNSTFVNTGLATAVQSPGFFNDGTNSVMTNSGTIQSGSSNAITNVGNNNRVFNQGNLFTTGNTAPVVFSDVPFFEIVNTGMIRSEGSSSFGIQSDSGDFIASNSGSILTGGDDAIGITLNADSIFTVTNYGFISTLGSAAHGIQSQGSEVSITSTGAISVVGPNAHAVNIDGGTNVQFINSGTVVAQGTGGDGVTTSAANMHVVNSGTIVSLQANALNFAGTDPSLTLLRGSNLQGAVQTTNPLDLNVQRGLNLALSLASGSFDTLNIDAPFVLANGAVAVVDPTGFAVQADAVADLSDTFLGGIYRHRAAFPSVCADTCGCSLWVEGVGSYRERHKKGLSRYEVKQGGFLVGLDFRGLGLFGGAAFGDAFIGECTQETTIRSYVGGVSYEMIASNQFFGVAFLAGYSSLDNSRYVMNNLAPNGVDKAQACPSGFFLSPELTYVQSFPQFWCMPTLSGTVRFASLFLGDYSETGSLANLAVADRNVQLVTLRGELGFPSCHCFLDWEPYMGGAGRFQLDGCEVEGALLGQNLHFTTALPANLGYFLIGLRGLRSVGCFDLFLNLEINFDSAQSFRVFGESGISYIF